MKAFVLQFFVANEFMVSAYKISSDDCLYFHRGYGVRLGWLGIAIMYDVEVGL